VFIRAFIVKSLIFLAAARAAGTGEDGTIYIFSKNGEQAKHEIMTLQAVEYFFGKHKGLYNHNN